MDNRASEIPCQVTAFQGEVLVDGPAGTAFSLAPEAAIRASDLMFKAGVEAEAQRRRGEAPATFDMD